MWEVNRMKADKLRTFLVSALLAAALALGSVGAFATAFELLPEVPVRVALILAAVSLLGALLCPRRHGTLLLLCAGGLMLGYLWRTGDLPTAVEGMLDTVTGIYDRAYGWGSTGFGVRGSTDLLMTVWGSFIALGTARAVSCRKSALWGLVPAVVGFFPCLVVTDTVPAPGFLLLFLLSALLLVLSATVRKESAGQGCRLILRAALSVALMLAGLMALLPENSYVNRSEEIRNRLSGLVQDLPEQVIQTVTPAVQSTLTRDSVDLQALGPQSEQKLPILDVYSDTAGLVYLRGRDYDRYTGTGWESSPDRQEFWVGEGDDPVSVQVRTLTGALQNLYLPCFPATAVNLRGGRLENTEHLRIYEVTRYANAAPSNPPDGDYSLLPEETSARALALLEQAGLTGAAPEAIGDFVRNHAVYDRQTGTMPRNETDFALWFLESSETGYCVHFATAAAVLLRANGTPARYVTGYLTRARAGSWSTVTAAQAHAWVEYYNWDRNRWEILDATPAGAEPDEETSEPSFPESSAPPELGTDPMQDTPDDLPADYSAETLPEDTGTAPAGGTGLWPLWVILGVTGAVGGLEAQRSLRRLSRRRKLTQGTGNRQCLALWQEAEKTAALLGEKPPAALFAAAQKAKYSQYSTEDAELALFRTYLRTARERLNALPLPRRLLNRYLHAV